MESEKRQEPKVVSVTLFSLVRIRCRHRQEKYDSVINFFVMIASVEVLGKCSIDEQLC